MKKALHIQCVILTCQLSITEPKIHFSSTWRGACWLLCVMKGGALESKLGVGTKVEAKTPINTLITIWQVQAVPVKDTLGHWWDGDKCFPRANRVRMNSAGIILSSSKAK